nr:hypothetical protein [Propionibacterium sp.]
MEWALALVLVVTIAVVGWWWRRRAAAPRVPDTFEELLAGGAELAVLNERYGDAPGAPFPGPRARAWAYGVLHSEGVDADADPRYAADLLRRAEPRLSRAAAAALVRAML